MAEGTITVEVSTQAAREEIDRLREELACVRQALPEMWRDSELSVAVSTLAAENDLLKREAHTWSKAAEHYAKDAERWHAELQHDVLGPGSEARSATVLGLNDVDKKTGLILRLQDEADLCRNDGANDIAALLDEAVEALRDRNHDTQVGEKWREDSRLETWFPLTAEKLAPLTHMQIVMLWGDRSDGPSTPEIVSFARHVERAHGIGPNARLSRDQQP